MKTNFLVDEAHRAFAKVFMQLAMPSRLKQLQDRVQLYAQSINEASVRQWQISAFNRQWGYAKTKYDFYKQWQKMHRLPDKIHQLHELNDFPVLRKCHIQDNIESIARQAAPCTFVSTGGSTGEPTKFPRSDDDVASIYSAMYLGRSWWDIKPGDRIIHIWGHAHLFGTGIGRRKAIASRKISDWLINTKRLDAYRLDDEALAQHWRVLKGEPGAIIVSYTSVVRRILDYLEDNRINGRDAKLRTIILTSEPVDHSDTTRVSRILGAPVAIEYGTAETGVLAYTRPGSTILHFLWDSFHCHIIQEGELAISTLNDLRFPLINYGTGDVIDGVESDVPFSCRAIRGRTNDRILLTMCDGSNLEVHSELLTHVIKTEPTVRSFFIHQKGRQIDVSLRALLLCQRLMGRILPTSFLATIGKSLTVRGLQATAMNAMIAVYGSA
jgi:phenylacetate-coenzyme A ligase PaaK-like adenylate-forming protein